MKGALDREGVVAAPPHSPPLLRPRRRDPIRHHGCDLPTLVNGYGVLSPDPGADPPAAPRPQAQPRDGEQRTELANYFPSIGCDAALLSYIFFPSLFSHFEFLACLEISRGQMGSSLFNFPSLIYCYIFLS